MKMGKIYYSLNEEGRKKSLLNGGDGKQIQNINVELNEKNIALFSVDSEGNAKLDLTSNLLEDYKIDCGFSGNPYIREIKETVLFNDLKASEELLEFEKNRIQKISEKKPLIEIELINKKEQYEKEQKLKRQKEEEERKICEEKKRLESKKSKEKEKQKASWINSFGSNYLKRAYNHGFDCQRKYATERAAREFPNFQLDFDDEAGWNDRSAPTEEALEILESILKEKEDKNLDIEVNIVWLTKPPKNTINDEEYYSKELEFEECESVVITNYLDRYNLIKIID